MDNGVLPFTFLAISKFLFLVIDRKMFTSLSNMMFNTSYTSRSTAIQQSGPIESLVLDRAQNTNQLANLSHVLSSADVVQRHEYM